MDTRSYWKRPRRFDQVLPLSEADPRAEEPPGFVGELYPPQATMLQAMLDLTSDPRVEICECDTLVDIMGERHVHDSYYVPCRALIAEKFSFGKTVLCVAYLLANKARGTQPAPPYPVNVGYVINNYARHARYLPTALVLAQPSVISEWEAAVKRFAPSLRCHVIANKRSLEEYDRALRGGEHFDVVLLKNGNVTTNYVVPGEPRPDKTVRHLTEALMQTVEGAAFETLILDDYDLLTYTAFTPLPYAMFTWVISATDKRRNCDFGVDMPSGAHANTISWICQDPDIRSILKMKCEDRFVERSMATTLARVTTIRVRGGRPAQMAAALNAPPEVIEALNAGAVQEAAAHYGIVTDNPADIVRHLLRGPLKKYKRATCALKHLGEPAPQATGTPAAEKRDPEGTNILVAQFRDAMRAPEDLEASYPISGSAMKRVRESLKKWAEKVQANEGKMLERFLANAREEKCQCCYVPIEEGDPYIILSGCCQIVICQDCGTDLDTQGKARGLISKCPLCATQLSPQNLMFCEGAHLEGGNLEDEIQKILSARDEPTRDKPANEDPAREPARDPAHEPARDPARDAADVLEFIENINHDDFGNKLRALAQYVWAISNGNDDPQGDIDCISLTQEPFAGGPAFMKMERDVARPPGTPPKYLIISGFGSSNRHVKEVLDGIGVSHLHLRGRVSDRAEIKQRFRTDPTIRALIANTTQDASGLNLPEVTHVIILHTMDPNTESQAIARALRFERTYNLEVVRILFERE